MDKGYTVSEIAYSKVVGKASFGVIVTKQQKKYFLLNYPELSVKEDKLFLKVLEEVRQSKNAITTISDIYFFLKSYCIENLILLNKEEREKIILLLGWETLGESILTQLLKEESFEEVVINGANKAIIVYHRNFGWLTTNCSFTSEEKIKTIINKMSAPLGRQLSFQTPIINATLENGSRLNATMNPIAFSGINATIRKFKEKPMTPLDIINSGAINSQAMAFLWLCMQSSCSILVCGNTGSGKTTTLNSLFCFLPNDERIVVVEETPEIVLPQEHKVKLNIAQQLGIGLEELINNTFRMRPDRVIVGEIRSKEEAKAFVNTMLAGQAKGSYATFHAENSEEALNRIKSFGIEENFLGVIDLIVVQKRIQKINHKKGTKSEERRITEICEVNKEKEKIHLERIFTQEGDKLLMKGRAKKCFAKIENVFSCTEKEALELMNEKSILLKKLNEGILFNEFFELAEKEM